MAELSKNFSLSAPLWLNKLLWMKVSAKCKNVTCIHKNKQTKDCMGLSYNTCQELVQLIFHSKIKLLLLFENYNYLNYILHKGYAASQIQFCLLMLGLNYNSEMLLTGFVRFSSFTLILWHLAQEELF